MNYFKTGGSHRLSVSGIYCKGEEASDDDEFREEERNGNGNGRSQGNGFDRDRPYKGRRYQTASQHTVEKRTFNEDEYTKITTPRQDVLFKKGYLGRKKAAVPATSNGDVPNGVPNGIPNGATNGANNGDCSPAINEEAGLEAENGWCNGDYVPGDDQSQYYLGGGFVDQNGVYYGPSYELYDPYSGNLTVVVGPIGAPPPAGWGPPMMSPYDWYNPRLPPPGSAPGAPGLPVSGPGHMGPPPDYCYMHGRKKYSVDSQNCSGPSSESTGTGPPGSPQECDSVGLGVGMGVPGGATPGSGATVAPTPLAFQPPPPPHGAPFIFPGYVFGTPIYNVDGVPVAAGNPLGTPCDLTPAGRRRRKKSRRKRRRGGATDDGLEESSSDEKDGEGEADGDECGESRSSQSTTLTDSDTPQAPTWQALTPPHTPDLSVQPELSVQPAQTEPESTAARCDPTSEESVKALANVTGASAPLENGKTIEATTDRRDCTPASQSVPINEVVSVNGDLKTNGTNEEHVTNRPAKAMPPVTAKENKQNGKKRGNEGKAPQNQNSSQSQKVNGGRGKGRKNKKGVCNGNATPPEEVLVPCREPAEKVEPVPAPPVAAVAPEAPKAPPRRKKWQGRHVTKERAPTPGRDLAADPAASDESNLSWSSSSDDSVVAILSDTSASSVEDDTVIFRPPTVTAVRRASVDERLTNEVNDDAVSRVPVHSDEPQLPLDEPERRDVAEEVVVRTASTASATPPPSQPQDLPQEPVAGPLGAPLHITDAVTRWLHDQNVEQVLLTDATGSSSTSSSSEDEDGDDQDQNATRSTTGPKNGFRNPFPASSHKCSRRDPKDDVLRKRVAQKTEDSGSESGTEVWDASRLCDPTLFVAKYYRLGDEHGPGTGSGSEAGSGSVVMALELRTSPDEVSWAEECSWPATLPKTATIDSGIHTDESSDEQTPKKAAKGSVERSALTRGRPRRPKTPARALLNQLNRDGSYSCGGICCVIQ